MDYIIHISELLYNLIISVISYPFDRHSRIFILYLYSALVFSYFVYRASGYLNAIGPPLKERERGFIKFLFPSYIWREKSAWLDVKYFFFHQLIRLSIYGTFLFARWRRPSHRPSPIDSAFSKQLSAVDNIYVCFMF